MDGISSPLSLFMAGLRLCMWMVSLYFRAQYLVSLSITFTLSIEQELQLAIREPPCGQW